MPIALKPQWFDRIFHICQDCANIFMNKIKGLGAVWRTAAAGFAADCGPGAALAAVAAVGFAF
jgi:hypothetical protein